MRKISQLADNESKRLAAIDLAKPKQSVEAAEAARAALDKGDLAAANESLGKARDLWSVNELVQRLDKDVAAARTAASTAAAASEPAAEEKPAPKATPKPASTEPAAGDAAPAPAAAPVVEEESSGNPLRIIVVIVIAALAIGGWKAYKSVQKKANEVIE